jgi:alkanesulfonate monooxygenase SsuD/methylene tetrahydromethanopterin reductase-like flavin-dependent oxidoreductase (luciferase family)
LLPPQDAQRAYSPAEEAQAQALRRSSLVGSAQQVRERLEALAAQLQVQELVVLTWAWDPAVQRRSYELLADAFALA